MRLRILIADDEPSMCEYLTETLRVLGHVPVATAQTGRELVDQCRALQPDMVITDVKMPDMDGLAAAAEIYAQHPVPIIVVSAYYDAELIEIAERNHIASYLIKPIREAQLSAAIVLAAGRFEEFQTLHKQTADLRQALEDRKVIERAKGILMKWAKLQEAEAFTMLQKMASHERKKLIDMAQAIILKDRVASRLN